MRPVLMVAFHYPPIAASIGALRSHAFASYLPRSGWRAHVLAPSVRAYEAIDSDADTTGSATVHRCWALDAQRHLGIQGRYSVATAIPDRWAAWAPAAIAAGLRIIRKYSVEAIWSTYPIATSHLIAGTLARLSGLPWVAEYRDPVGADALPRPQRWARNSIERWSARKAEQLIFVTPSALGDFGQRYPETGNRLHLIPNGYDESREPDTPRDQRARSPDTPLALLHSGHLYPAGRNPAALFNALARLKHDGRIDASSLRVTFRNSQTDAVYQSEIDRLNIGDIVTLAPRIAHREAQIEQRNADGLLLLQGAEFNRQVPAKLFEYLRAHRPILALVDHAGDTANMLDELGGGLKVALDDSEDIAAGLMQFISRIDAGAADGHAAPWPVDEQALARYSRVSQTEVLADLLDRVTNR